MQLNNRQLILYFLACVVLYSSGLPGGGLLAIAVFYQILIHMKNWAFTKQSQWGQLRLVLMSAPLFIFWGGAHSFIFIYLQERSLFMAASASVLSFLLTLIIYFQMIWILNYFEQNDFKVTVSYQKALLDLKKSLKIFLNQASIFYILTFVPFLTEEWKLVFAITAMCSYLNRSALKTVLVNPLRPPQ